MLTTAVFTVQPSTYNLLHTTFHITTFYIQPLSMTIIANLIGTIGYCWLIKHIYSHICLPTCVYINAHAHQRYSDTHTHAVTPPCINKRVSLSLR